MVYSIFDGKNLEEIFQLGNKTMLDILINQNKCIRRKLLDERALNNFQDLIEDSIYEVKRFYFSRWKQASNYVELGNGISMLDHYLAIDSILEINEEIWIGIDWTINNNSKDLLKKLEVHKKLKAAHKKLGLNYSIIALINNSALINQDNASFLLFKILKLIEHKSYSADFKGGISINIKDLLK